MATTMGYGSFSGNLTHVKPQSADMYEDVIRMYLQNQSASFQTFYTEDEFFWMIRNGLMNVWLYEEEGKDVGMVCFTMHIYSETVKTIKIEFLSCRHFFKMAKLLEVMEHQARKEGFTYIEALAHPTIAEFALKKGFAAPAVYIIKPVQFERRN